jgi:membrane protein
MKKKVTLKGIWEVLKESFKGFGEHKITKLSASLAYYTVFSLGPLLIIIIFASGMILGREAAEGTIYRQMDEFVGHSAALQMQEIVKNASLSDKGTVAVIIGIITLLIGATTVFAEIQDSINTIWSLKPKAKLGMWVMLKNRLLSFGVIVGLGFLLLVSLAVTAIASALGNKLAELIPAVGPVVIYIINFIITLAIVTVLFAAIFKVLPDAKIKWKDVFPGALATGILFIIGKFLISFYIGASDIGSTYGTAGSLVILIVWIYYSSIILYFGAEFTKAYAVKYGAAIHPNHYAVVAKTIEVEEGQKSVQQVEKKHAAAKENNTQEELLKQHRKEHKEHKEHKKAPVVIRDMHPPAPKETTAPTPAYSNYAVPRQRALIKAPKKAGVLTLVAGLVLWFFNSDKKLTS